MKRISAKITSLFMTGILVFCERPAAACAVCFGTTDSKTILSLQWGIGILLGILLCLMGGVIAFFINVNRKSKMILPG